MKKRSVLYSKFCKVKDQKWEEDLYQLYKAYKNIHNKLFKGRQRNAFQKLLLGKQTKLSQN